MTVVAARGEAEAQASSVASVRSRLDMSRLAIVATQILLVVGLLAAWEVSSRTGFIDPMLFGTPSAIGPAIREYLSSSEGLSSLTATALAVLWSFVIGSTLGILAGLVLGLSQKTDAVFGPFLTPINSIPRIALAPLFIAWFGLTTTSKVVLAVSIVFFILAENARSAVRSVDTEVMRMGRVVGLGPAMQLWKVVVPSAVPTLFSGVRLAFTYSLLGVVASEMIAARDGVGQDIVLFSTSYQIDSMFAVLAVLVAVSIAVNTVFAATERRFLRWKPKDG